MSAAVPLPPKPPPPPRGPTWGERFAPLVRAFHAYAAWLVSISWKRFVVLSLLLLVISGVLQNIPPFTWTISETVETLPPKVVIAPVPPPPPAPPKAGTGAEPAEPVIRIERPKGGGSDESVEITIGKHGVRVTPRNAPAAASAAEAAASAAQAAERAERTAREFEDKGIQIVVPAGSSAEVRRAIEEARESIRAAVEQAKADAQEAKADAEEAVRDAERAIEELQGGGLRKRITRTSLGETLPQLAFLWIVCSALLKASYKRQLTAQAQAAQATEVAESEQLKRQVVEARMAAMQAQVEPHFLFNTLASIDHLIETDPPRASQMQRNLIALLRASMPTMREANNGAPRDLAREMAMVRPYLEILKVRMEERLAIRIDVPEGLLSAEFPPMMIQSLVENAVRHGLEPKAEGGELAIRCEIVHGKLNVVVADTGLGFGKAATAGTGVGLANIRERLALLYGREASVAVTENRPSGTVVTIALPYRTVAPGGGRMTPGLRTALWLVGWATLLVSLVLGAFVAWLLSEVLPPGTVITVDGERFVLPAFSHAGHWLTALVAVLIASLAIVLVVPVVALLALVVPAAVGGLGIALALLLTALVLWPLVLLGRRLYRRRGKAATISA